MTGKVKVDEEYLRSSAIGEYLTRYLIAIVKIDTDFFLQSTRSHR